MSTENILRKFVGKFDVEMQLKAMVASCFLRDGADLLELFDCGLQTERQNRSYRAKLFINLRMAIECWLKALIIIRSESTETAEMAYLAARNGGHNLARLIAEARSRGSDEKLPLRFSTLALITEVNEMSVRFRYEIDLVSAFSKESLEEQMFQSGPTSGKLESSEWFLKLRKHARSIERRAGKAFRKKLGNHRAILGTDLDKRKRRVQKFMKDVGIE